MRWAAETIVLATLLGAGVAEAQSCHEGTVEGEEIVWRSTIDGSLAGPLPRGLTIERVRGGRLVERARIEGGRTEIVSRQAIGDGLTPPLARGPQRITISGADAERISFAPAADTPIERHVGYQASPDITHEAIRALDLDCGRAPARSVRIYVEPRSYADLRGTIARGDDHERPFLWIGGLLLVAACAGGAFAYRRLSKRAELEDAEAAIEERFRAIEE